MEHNATDDGDITVVTAMVGNDKGAPSTSNDLVASQVGAVSDGLVNGSRGGDGSRIVVPHPSENVGLLDKEIDNDRGEDQTAVSRSGQITKVPQPLGYINGTRLRNKPAFLNVNETVETDTVRHAVKEGLLYL